MGERLGAWAHQVWNRKLILLTLGLYKLAEDRIVSGVNGGLDSLVGQVGAVDTLVGWIPALTWLAIPMTVVVILVLSWRDARRAQIATLESNRQEIGDHHGGSRSSALEAAMALRHMADTTLVAIGDATVQSDGTIARSDPQDDANTITRLNPRVKELEAQNLELTKSTAMYKMGMERAQAQLASLKAELQQARQSNAPTDAPNSRGLAMYGPPTPEQGAAMSGGLARLGRTLKAPVISGLSGEPQTIRGALEAGREVSRPSLPADGLAQPATPLARQQAAVPAPETSDPPALRGVPAQHRALRREEFRTERASLIRAAGKLREQLWSLPTTTPEKRAWDAAVENYRQKLDRHRKNWWSADAAAMAALVVSAPDPTTVPPPLWRAELAAVVEACIAWLESHDAAKA